MPLLVPDKVNMNYANMIEEASLKVSCRTGGRGCQNGRIMGMSEVADHARKLLL
jgi:hypothetical protein